MPWKRESYIKERVTYLKKERATQQKYESDAPSKRDSNAAM